MCSLPALERAALLGPRMRDAVPFEDTTRTLVGAFEGFAHGDSVDRALKTDLQVYLPDDILTLTDRLSMWHSLELRVPFLDHRLVERAMAVPSNLKVAGLTQKKILKNIAAKYLPRSVIDHRKQGFEAPMGAWLRGPLRELMNDVLDPASIRADGIFDATQVERLKREHLSGARKHSKIIFSLLMFTLWKQSANEVTVEPRIAAAN